MVVKENPGRKKIRLPYTQNNCMRLSRRIIDHKTSTELFWLAQPTSNAMINSKISESFLAMKIQKVYLSSHLGLRRQLYFMSAYQSN